MRFRSFTVENFKSYDEPVALKFERGFNVVVGPNNAGKTALLEALTVQIRWNPHKSLRTLPRETSPIPERSSVQLTIVVTAEELADSVGPLQEFRVPVPEGVSESEYEAKRLLDSLLAAPELELHLGFMSTRQRGSDGISSGFFPTRIPTVASINARTQRGEYRFFNYLRHPKTGQFVLQSMANAHAAHDSFYGIATSLVGRNLYAFKAERLALAEAPFGPNAALLSNASNLAEVVHVMQTTKPGKFKRLLQLMREIFPGLADLSVRAKATGSNVQEIVIWNEQEAADRSDLAFTLSESGTGLGQVLAMLYVVLNAEAPLVIIIDEPNSFLHPAASRKLLEVLREFPRHQYILATHSPEIVRASEPATLTLVRREGPRSLAVQLDANSLEAQQECLNLLGVRLSDVFGADYVLWVEGLTEEAVFPLLLHRITGHPLVSVLAVRSVSELQGKRKRLELVLEVYRRLTKSNSLAPRAYGFVFDSDGLRENEKTDIVRQSGGLITFLPRRMLENYLIVPEAIATALNRRAGFRASQLTAETVADWIRKRGRDTEFFPDSAPRLEPFSASWTENVHAARLFDSLVTELSEGRERYDKVSDGFAIASNILQSDVAQFSELRELLSRKVLART